MRKVLLLLPLVLLGCAAAQTAVTSSSPRTVAVRSFKGMQDAQNAADAECKKHGRLARWVSGDIEYIFDCVN